MRHQSNHNEYSSFFTYFLRRYNSHLFTMKHHLFMWLNDWDLEFSYMVHHLHAYCVTKTRQIIASRFFVYLSSFSSNNMPTKLNKNQNK